MELGHYPVLVKNGQELRVRKEKKGWAVWAPYSEEERQKFKRRVLCFEDSRTWVDGGQEVGEWCLEVAAAVVKATKTATRNKNMFKIPAESRELAKAAKCRIPILRKEIWKNQGSQTRI